MKLVEILARNIKRWESEPSPVTGKHMVLRQRSNGDIYNANSMAIYIGQEAKAFRNFELSDDWESAEVTHAQWEAERSRITAMEGSSAFSQDQSNAEAERDHRTQYDQELWDKAALAALSGVCVSPEEWGCKNESDATIQSFIFADAFMAERAKRLKK